MFTKMMTKILFLAFVATVVHSLPVNDASADKLVDQLLEVVKTKYGAQLDPMHLNDTVAEFHKKVGIITFHGDAKLTEGTITGLKGIKRSGECTLTTDKGFQAHLQFGDNNIHVHFKGELQFMDLKTSGLLDVGVSNFDVKANVALNSAGKLEIQSFDVDELKQVSIDFKGPIKVLDGVIDKLGEGFIKVFNKQARELLDKVLKNMIQKELEQMHFPPQ